MAHFQNLPQMQASHWPHIDDVTLFVTHQAKQREVYLRETQRVNDLSNDVEATKATLGKAATELAQKSAQNEGE
jgi:hypothetical protein